MIPSPADPPDAAALGRTGPAGGALVSDLLAWVDVPSVTGAEADFADLAARTLAARGLDVERIDAGDGEGRACVFARLGSPRVVLCTHLDTVPPWFGARADRTHVHGRGSCDAKGPALAMAEAVRRLAEDGVRDVGLLWTVGEEVDSDGAAAANRALLEGRLGLDAPPAFVVVGEPTGNRFVRGHKGMLRARLAATGVPAHSSEPLGPSAIHALVGCCARLVAEPWGEHPLFGPGSLNIGTIAGGVADNVVAGSARADLLVRAVEPPDAVETRLRACLGDEVALAVHAAYGPVEFEVPEGEQADVVAFGTDAPYLEAWGRPLLIGPGDIADAHTEHEKLSIAALHEGVARYEALVRDLLART